MTQTPKFELWLVDERGVLSKPRDKSDHTGFAKPGSVRGWARIERSAIVLFRTDEAANVPANVKRYYAARFPAKKIEDRIDVHRRIAEAVYLNIVERATP